MSAQNPRNLRIGRLAETDGWAVELGGQDIASALKGLSLTIEGPHMVSARLDILVEDLSTEAEVKAWLPDVTKDLLVRLGWTPPAEEATP